MLPGPGILTCQSHTDLAGVLGTHGFSLAQIVLSGTMKTNCVFPRRLSVWAGDSGQMQPVLGGELGWGLS